MNKGMDTERAGNMLLHCMWGAVIGGIWGLPGAIAGVGVVFAVTAYSDWVQRGQ